jgi:hypothetical protein
MRQLEVYHALREPAVFLAGASYWYNRECFAVPPTLPPRDGLWQTDHVFDSAEAIHRTVRWLGPALEAPETGEWHAEAARVREQVPAEA